MKTFYALLFCCFGLNAGAQTYLTIPDSNATWSESYAVCNPPQGSQQSTTYELYSRGDTLINTFTYKMIYESGHGMNNFCGIIPNTLPPDFTFQNQLRGFIRESGNGQVFYRSVQMSADTLLFDYNRLIPGQQFPNCYIYDSLLRANSNGDLQQFYITHIDTIAYNSQLRRRYNLTGYSLNDTATHILGSLIEGIGSSFGLTNQLFYASGFGPSRDGALYCYREDNQPQLLIGMGNSMGCFTFYGITEAAQKPIAFTLQPNPTDRNFRIQMPENYSGTAELVIYNLLGQPVYRVNKMTCNGTNSIFVDVENMPPGIYNVHVNPSQGRPGTQRLVIR
jgi:hypothetical protein